MKTVGANNGRERMAIIAAGALSIASALCTAFIDIPFMFWLKEVDCLFFHRIGFFSLLGNSACWLAPALLLFAMLRLASRRAAGSRRKRLLLWAERALFLFAAILISGIFNDLLKIIIGRARPVFLYREGLYDFLFLQFKAKMWSFPSGHANTIFAVATAAFLSSPARYGIIYYFFATFIAFTRTLNGSHFPSDVLAGAAIALLTTPVVHAFFQHRGDALKKSGTDAVVPQRTAPKSDQAAAQSLQAKKTGE